MEPYDRNESLIQIESKLAYQEDDLLKLKETVLQQQKQMYHLEQKFEKLLERFTEIQEADSGTIKNEKPPHY